MVDVDRGAGGAREVDPPTSRLPVAPAQHEGDRTLVDGASDGRAAAPVAESPEAAPTPDPDLTPATPPAAAVDQEERRGFRHSLGAFRSRNFTLFWSGALVSSTGNWVQAITVPFVIFQITGEERWLGYAAAMQFAPFVLTGAIGGALADRYQRRTVLLITQSAMAVAAFALWGIWSAGVRSPIAILGVVFVNGLISGLGIPAWQAFVTELVPREDLLNAVTLNSAQFNAARAFGPAIGGLVLGFLGVGWAFFINGVSFAAVIVALLAIAVPKLVKPPASERPGVIRGFMESIRYSVTKPGIAVCLIVVLALGGLGSPMIQLLAAFAERVYGVGDLAYGILGAAAGLGAVIGTPLIVGPGARLPRSRLTAIAMFVYGLSVVGFGLSPVYAAGLVALLVSGAGYLAIASTLNTTVQLQVDEDMRGKVLALYVMCLTIALPVGGLLEGLLAQAIGPQAAVTIFGSLFLAVWAWLRFGRRGRLAAMDEDPHILA